jgi:hypothetical protein
MAYNFFIQPCMESFLPLMRKTAILCLSRMMVRSLYDTAVYVTNSIS